MASTNVVPSPGRLKTLSATINLAGEQEKASDPRSFISPPRPCFAHLISHPPSDPAAGQGPYNSLGASAQLARCPLADDEHPRPLALLSRGPWVGRVPGRVTLPVKRELASCDDTRLHSLYRFDTGLAAPAGI